MDFRKVNCGLARLRVLLLLVMGGGAVHHGLPIDFLTLGGPVADHGGLSGGRCLCHWLLPWLIDRLALAGFLVWFLCHLSLDLLILIAGGARRVLLPF